MGNPKKGKSLLQKKKKKKKKKKKTSSIVGPEFDPALADPFGIPPAIPLGIPLGIPPGIPLGMVPPGAPPCWWSLEMMGLHTSSNSFCLSWNSSTSPSWLFSNYFKASSHLLLIVFFSSSEILAFRFSSSIVDFMLKQ